MSSGETRLERALQVWLRYRSGEAGDRDALLAANPDVADLLLAMLDDSVDEPSADAEERTLGDFRLRREVGRGGMGVVYDARQLSLDRRVALKVLPHEVTGSPTNLARFRREALTLARLDHPHVVGIYDVGETEGVHWLAMEFIDGQSLEQRLEFLRANGHRGDSLRQLVEVIAEVAEALHHAHAADVVHRDVKPSNILLREDGGAVLTDFGLARDASSPSVTANGAVAGTPHTMSPEQVAGRGSDLDARSDVFSLGATLYECLTLRRAFQGANVEQVLHRIVTRDPVDPRRHAPGLPADLAAIVLKALEKRPADRYATARLFADDLRAFLALRPVRARPLSTVTRARRWLRREPMKAGLAATMLAASALGVIILTRLPDIRAGVQAQRERDYEDAIVQGFVARTNKDQAAAYASFERARAIAPDRAEAVIGVCLAAKQFEGALPALAKLDSIGRGFEADPDVRRLRAQLLRWAERRDDAAAIEKDLPPPGTATALWLAAGSDVLSDDPAVRRHALADASLAVRIAPTPRLLLHVQWAACAWANDDPPARREAARTLVALWPEHPVALHYAGLCLVMLEPARAAELIANALRRGLDDRHSHYNLAAALVRCNRGQEAVAAMRTACAANPDNDVFRTQLIDLLARLGDSAGMRAECEQWMAQAPDNLTACRMLAQALSADGELPRALELSRRVTTARPQDVEAGYDLAVFLDEAGDYGAAKTQVLAVLALAPSHDRAHKRLLGVLKDLDDPPAMLAEMERWAKVRPDDPEAAAMFARGVLAVGRTDLYADALAAAERADYLARGENAEYLTLRADVLAKTGDETGAARFRQLALARTTAAGR